MRLLNLKQNSAEWSQFRETKIGASDCPAICGKDPFKTARALFNQKFYKKNQWESPAMRRGKVLEPIAREMISRMHGICYLPVVALHDTFDWMMASFDGYDQESNTIIEIKCPSDKKFEMITFDGEIPIEYIYQVHHQMIIANTSKALLVPFNGLYYEEIPIYRDDEVVKEIMAKEQHFHECLTRGEYAEPQ